MVYIVSDIHGCFKTFLALLKKVKFDEDNDSLYILGDIIDRGPLIWELYEWIKKRQEQNKNVFMILGNHESMFIQDILTIKGRELTSSNSEINSEYDNLCVRTYKRNIYEMDEYKTIRRLREKGKTTDDLVEMSKFFLTLPLYYLVNIRDKEYRLVHAYCRKDLEKTLPMEFIWNRDFAEYKDVFCIGKNVIFGHTPLNKKIEICIDEKTNSTKINMDCGCVYGGRLGILRLDDMECFYQKNIDEV